MNTISVWEKTSAPPSYPVLDKDISTDVLIIGAGITGLTAGLELAKAGVKTTIIEALRAGDGTTGYSTGNLYVPVQSYYQNIRDKFDLPTARAIAQSRKQALDYIEAAVKEYDIDCHFARRPDYLFVDEKNRQFLEKEAAILKECSIEVEFKSSMPFPSRARQIAFLPHQARLNPKTYIDGLAKAFVEAGGQLFEHSPIIATEEKPGQCYAITARHKINAAKVIMATHTPKGIHMMQALAAPYRSYVVAATLKSGEYPDGHFWDADPGGYISSTHAVNGEKLDMLMVAGEHHKTGQAAHGHAEYCYKRIETYIRDHFEVESILHRWSAQHYQAADGIPYIGLARRGSKNFYAAGGYFADGLTYGTVAGCLLADLVQGKANPLAGIYNPLRFTPAASAAKAIKENINVLGEYLKDLPGLNSTSTSAIKPGEGSIVEANGEKCAVYRDEKGALHAVSAVCTHMKCIVRFNNAEKTWDCPCHGSRFAVDGAVLEGPAYEPLAHRSIGK
jgi:glycine/D-amino acid oxidase-like deaminating enzyme/nitrite reductase/ring-hydroxylating ferredoxin subunit